MIRNVVVCGAGTMGRGIAEAIAQTGIPILLYDLDPAVIEKAKKTLVHHLDTLISKAKITQEKKESIISLIKYSTDIQSCHGDLIIEAVVEKLSIKTALFNELLKYNDSTTIFATNTSSLSINAIAEATTDPDRVCGLHFFNPAQVMKLVEVVKADQTTEETVDIVMEFCRQIGKTAVLCKDSPGFIVNRVARHYYLESLKIAEENNCTIESIDALLESAGFKMGPFKLMDLIGNDINFAVTQSLYEACGKPIRFKPSPLQEAKVNSGELGRKTNKGFYDYTKE